jgi:molybdate transport system substrate-binding protein
MMRTIFLAAVTALLLPVAAQAATITVFTTGLVGTGIRALGTSWGAQTGNTINFVSGPAIAVSKSVASGTPGDMVVMTDTEFALFEPRVVKSSRIEIGRIPYGVGVAAGAPHPDVSTEAALQATLKSAKMVSYNNPAIGRAGTTMQALLARPGYEGVKVLLTNGGSAGAIPKGQADMTLGVVTEELSTNGVEVAGNLPVSLGLHQDFSAATLAGSAQSEAAASFLAYIARPEAAAAWRAGGVVTPIP